MKKKSLLLCIILLINSTIVISKNKEGEKKEASKTLSKAEEILKTASEKYNEAGGIKATFELNIFDSKDKLNQTYNGKINLKGKQFNLEVEDMETWFDGKNQWVYLKETKEVNLSCPSQEELLSINPINLFQLYKFNFNTQYLGTVNIDKKKLHKIRLTPPDKYNNIKEIIITFDFVTYAPHGIKIVTDENNTTRVNILTYLKKQEFTNNIFRFKPQDYPDAEIIDLR